MEKPFIEKLTAITEANISNAQFGVDELAREMGMSTSSLYRTKGWGLYKLGDYQAALEWLEKSERLVSSFQHYVFIHLEEVRNAIARKQ